MEPFNVTLYRPLVGETNNIISCDASTPEAVVFVNYFC